MAEPHGESTTSTSTDAAVADEAGTAADPGGKCSAG